MRCSRNCGFRGPEFFGFVVFAENGHPEPFRGKLELLREQFPGESNGFVLEVVAEGKVPQHFEECLMAPRVADVVEVVVLSPGAYNLLTCCRAVVGACFTAQEHFLELIHSRH